MSNFEWIGAFNIGIDEMDEEHHGLLSRMQKLETLSKSMTQKHKLLHEFKAFISFTTEHFQHEENLMQEFEYPSLLEHILIIDRRYAEYIQAKKPKPYKRINEELKPQTTQIV